MSTKVFQAHSVKTRTEGYKTNGIFEKGFEISMQYLTSGFTISALALPNNAFNIVFCDYSEIDILNAQDTLERSIEKLKIKSDFEHDSGDDNSDTEFALKEMRHLSAIFINALTELKLFS